AEEVARDLANKDAPAARRTAEHYTERTDETASEDRKALSHYISSIFSVCDKAKDQAEPHLKQAKSLEAAGKKPEALIEYREIYRIYPNPTTAHKIKQLEASP